MNLKLNTFNKKMSKEERKAASIVQNIELKGPIADDKELTKSFLEMMEYILSNYEFDKECVLRLKDENCKHCGHKLTRKGEYTKEINLPGGSSTLLRFYRYSCLHCKEPVDRKLSILFEPEKHYSKNVKADAIRLYSKHLSSYDLVVEELNKIYCLGLNKKTVIKWLKEAGCASEQVILEDDDFSGYIVYDEEFMKVFSGRVGIKGAKLEWIEVYLLLFRDVITGKAIILIVESLDEGVLKEAWIKVIRHLQSKGIIVKAFGTDGKREYHNYIKDINRDHGFKIQHVYDEFHFKKNLYESANEELFGSKHSKKELPEHIINQIKLVEGFFATESKEKARIYLDTLIFQKLTFIKSLRHHMMRLDDYFDDYTMFFEILEMKTTNLCEGWFRRTKPEKLKKGYKTINGLRAIANTVAIRINYDWQNVLNCKFDFTGALNGLLGALKAKFQAI